jgi:XRE family transcriptional regulator, regulator of sulfur utilization
MDLEKILAENVRNFRKLRGLTQKELAQVSGIHKQFWAGIERGERNITLSSLQRIAVALNVEPHVLITIGSARWFEKQK